MHPAAAVARPVKVVRVDRPGGSPEPVQRGSRHCGKDARFLERSSILPNGLPEVDNVNRFSRLRTKSPVAPNGSKRSSR